MSTARTAEEARAGAAFGPFALERELGRGGQAVVYRAREERTGAVVALKLLASFLGSSDRVRNVWRREVEALQRLDDPAIPRIREHGVLHGVPFLAMELVEGQPWRAVCMAESNGQPLAEDALRSTVAHVASVARVVERAHVAGVVHADLKPANLLIGSEGLPVVLDFGSAAFCASSDEAQLAPPGLESGTLAYAAPERLDGSQGGTQGPIDPRADVWSLGVVLAESITGRLPFRGATDQALQRKVLREPPDVRRGELPEELARVLEAALAKEPGARYAHAGEFAADLERWLADEPVQARRVPWHRRLAGWAHRDPHTALAALALVVTLVGWLGLASGAYLRLGSVLAASRRSRDLHSMPYLESVARDELWPALPERIPRMQAWLDEARDLAARVPRYAGAEIRLETELAGHTRSQAQAAELQAELGRVRNFLRRAVLLPERIADVERRRTAAAAAGRTVEDFAVLWSAACAEIADRARHPEYAGLALRPQAGLVPLGTDPSSGFLEFGHPRSGALPERDPATGTLRVGEDTCIVLVLVPGGRFTMGAVQPGPDSGQVNVDPQAYRDEGPLHAIELAPFFMSKYEITQGQWQRLEGENPSLLRPEHSHEVGARITLAHPVQGVSWEQCTEALRHHGLLLPTEAQWEYAARAGTTTPWSTGETRESLIGAANLADNAFDKVSSSAHALGTTPAAADWPELDDGFSGAAAVGSLRANPFGLHDVHGNVLEIVRDAYGPYSLPVRAGDGERQVGERRLCVLRGGGYFSPAAHLRSARRASMSPGSMMNLGVRPSRAIDP